MFEYNREERDRGGERERGKEGIEKGRERGEGRDK